jgi:hypothetical protein
MKMTFIQNIMTKYVMFNRIRGLKKIFHLKRFRGYALQDNPKIQVLGTIDAPTKKQAIREILLSGKKKI